MSYHMGIQGFSRPDWRYPVAIPDSKPHILCDSCGVQVNLPTGPGRPPAWFLDGRAPPGWKMDRNGEERLDKCPKCREVRS